MDDSPAEEKRIQQLGLVCGSGLGRVPISPVPSGADKQVADSLVPRVHALSKTCRFLLLPSSMPRLVRSSGSSLGAVREFKGWNIHDV